MHALNGYTELQMHTGSMHTCAHACLHLHVYVLAQASTHTQVQRSERKVHPWYPLADAYCSTAVADNSHAHKQECVQMQTRVCMDACMHACTHVSIIHTHACANVHSFTRALTQMIAVECQDNEVKTADGTCTVPKFKASFNSEKLDLTLYKPNPTLQNLPLLPVVDVQVEPGMSVFMRYGSIRNAL